MVLTHKYFEGKVPQHGEPTDYDMATLNEFADVKSRLEGYLDTFRFREAQKEAMNLARIGNKYLADTEPWKLAKTDMTRVAAILNMSLQIAANLAIAFEPFLPFSAARLRKMLGMNDFKWEQLGQTALLPDGSELGKTELLFEKIEDDAIEAQIKRLADIKEQNRANEFKPAEIKAPTSIEEFDKMDIRVAKVLECQKVPKADKLLQFTLDDGTGTPRTILSGIAKSYPEPEKLVGMQVLFIANFPPRKLRGIESQGMILSAVDADGQLVLVQPSREVKNGVQVG
jgi:methionyl-tRNA synthetase